MKTIFIVHSREDKDFVRKLANDLKQNGVDGQIDETMIKVGESLFEKIGSTIINADFIGVCLSNSSVKSEWVKKELEIALTEEIRKKTVYVLPILLEDCDIPHFLIGRNYVDFKDESQYMAGFIKLLTAIKQDSTKYDEVMLDRFGPTLMATLEKVTKVKIEQHRIILDQLIKQDEELFDYQEGYKKSINKIKMDPNLLASNTPQLLKYEQQLKEIKGARKKILINISEVQKKISNLLKNK